MHPATHLEEAVECDEHADHGQLIGINEVEGLGHGNEHLVIHAGGHTLQGRSGGRPGQTGSAAVVNGEGCLRVVW